MVKRIKAKKIDVLIDGVEYKMIEETNSNDTHWMSIPKVEDGVYASGAHIIRKARERSHWDKFNGKEKLPDEKEYISPPPKFNSMVINFKNHGTFPISPDNPITVLRGSDKPMEFISLEYYNKNKEKYLAKYSVLIGDKKDPQVLELKNN